MTARGARRLRWTHGVLAMLWLLPGGVVSWWLKDSVAWVTFMSLYAIVIGHVGAWQGARAEQAGS